MTRSGQMLALLALFGWLFAGTAEASVDEVGGGAFGESVEVVLGGMAAGSGPLPSVTLPPEGGGPFTDTASSVDLSAGVTSVLSTGVLTVSTEGGGLGSHQGFATSSAQVDDVSILTSVFTADKISSTCTSTGDGSTGSASFTNAQLNGTPIDADIEPNSSIAVAGVGTFLFNE